MKALNDEIAGDLEAMGENQNTRDARIARAHRDDTRDSSRPAYVIEASNLPSVKRSVAMDNQFFDRARFQ